MNAKEIKIKGIQYCESRGIENPNSRCDGCPFEDKIMCIDKCGTLCIDRRKVDSDFEDFVRDFNFMIKELYKDGNDSR